MDDPSARAIRIVLVILIVALAVILAAYHDLF
jgi:hypothetical protein